MIYDILIIAVIFLSLIIGYKKGAAKMLCSFLGALVSVLVSALLSSYLSRLIYSEFISPSVIESVKNTLSLGTVSNSQALQSLPPFVRFTLKLTSFDVEDSISAVENIPSSIAKSVDNAISEPVISLLSVVLSLILFIVVFFLFKLIFSKILCAVFDLPIIRTLNKLLGAVCSLLCSLVFIGFAAFILNILMPYMGDVPYIFSESTIYNSYIFYYFYSGNIFYKLISIF